MGGIVIYTDKVEAVKCYKQQVKYSPQHIEKFAEFIATKYDLNITVAKALELLK